MGSVSYPRRGARPKVVFGPVDSVCVDISDPRKIRGCNLPHDLKRLLEDLNPQDVQNWSDLEAESGLDNMSGYSSEEDVPPKPPKPDPFKDDTEHDDAVYPNWPIRRRRIAREPIDGVDGRSSEPRRTNGVVTDGATEKTDFLRKSAAADNGQESYATHQGRPALRNSQGRSRVGSWISTLVFGSRVGDYGIIYRESRDWYVDGPIFDRITDLRQWILPGLPDERLVIRTPLEPRDGKNIRLFVGPESTYFVFDKDREDFSTNIQDREFRAWLKGNTKPPAEEGGVRTFWPRCAPHSVALGPRDIFCVISTEGYKTSKAFKTAFPGIERYLEFAREAKILDKVNLTLSPDTQPGTKLPYFLLTTSNGVAVSSVPTDAIDLVATAVSKYGVVAASRYLKVMKRVQLAVVAQGQELSQAYATITAVTENLDAINELIVAQSQTIHPLEIRKKIVRILDEVIAKRPSRPDPEPEQDPKRPESPNRPWDPNVPDGPQNPEDAKHPKDDNSVIVEEREVPHRRSSSGTRYAIDV